MTNSPSSTSKTHHGHPDATASLLVQITAPGSPIEQIPDRIKRCKIHPMVRLRRGLRNRFSISSHMPSYEPLRQTLSTTASNGNPHAIKVFTQMTCAFRPLFTSSNRTVVFTIHPAILELPTGKKRSRSSRLKDQSHHDGGGPL